MSCPYAHDDGAYVLGALSAGDRLRFEEHLRGCASCALAVRELAGLPGLLGRVDATTLEAASTPEPVPPTLLPVLTHQVRRSQRRRTALVAAAAAAVTGVLGLGISLLGSRHDPAASPSADQTPSLVQARRMEPVGDVPVRATLAMEKVAWGTRLRLTCTYDPHLVDYPLPPVVDYVMVVRTRDGGTQRVGSWRSEGGRTLRLTAGTAAAPDQIASVQVRTTSGQVVLAQTS